MKHWNNITVEDYQLIYSIILDEEMHELDKEVKLIALMNEISEEDLNKLSLQELKKYKPSLEFLHNGKIEGELKQKIEANGRTYLMSLDAFKIDYGQYVDFTTFTSSPGGIVPNLNMIMASLAVPVTKNWIGMEKIGKYGDVKHNVVATDMLQANFADCYKTAIFFLKLINDLTKATVHYSVRQLLKEKKVTKQKLREILKPLKQDGDGFTTLNLLKSLNQ
jgi:hypothetical protein